MSEKNASIDRGPLVNHHIWSEGSVNHMNYNDPRCHLSNVLNMFKVSSPSDPHLHSLQF